MVELVFVVYVVFPIYFEQIVNNRSLGVHHSEKMRPLKCFIWLLWLLVINAELTLESVYQKVNDLEDEVTTLKVFLTTEIPRAQSGASPNTETLLNLLNFKNSDKIHHETLISQHFAV